MVPTFLPHPGSRLARMQLLGETPLFTPPHPHPHDCPVSRSLAGCSRQGCWTGQGFTMPRSSWLAAEKAEGALVGRRRAAGASAHDYLVSGRAAIRGPSSLMKKAEPSEDRMLEGTMEESSTSLAPTMFFLTAADGATPTTEESRVLPVTSLRPQVGGPRGLESERALKPRANHWSGLPGWTELIA